MNIGTRVPQKALQIWVSGKVQGVYFRGSTAKQARKLNLTGWVKNLADTRVEIFAQGNDESLDELLAWCKKGPVLAKVDEVTQKLAEIDYEIGEFEVLR